MKLMYIAFILSSVDAICRRTRFIGALTGRCPCHTSAQCSSWHLRCWGVSMSAPTQARTKSKGNVCIHSGIADTHACFSKLCSANRCCHAFRKLFQALFTLMHAFLSNLQQTYANAHAGNIIAITSKAAARQHTQRDC